LQLIDNTISTAPLRATIFSHCLFNYVCWHCSLTNCLVIAPPSECLLQLLFAPHSHSKHNGGFSYKFGWLHVSTSIFKNIYYGLQNTMEHAALLSVAAFPIRLPTGLAALLDQPQHHLKLHISGRLRIRHLSRLGKLLSLDSFMDQQCCIATVINDQIRATAWTPPPPICRSCCYCRCSS